MSLLPVTLILAIIIFSCNCESNLPEFESQACHEFIYFNQTNQQKKLQCKIYWTDQYVEPDVQLLKNGLEFQEYSGKEEVSNSSGEYFIFTFLDLPLNDTDNNSLLQCRATYKDAFIFKNYTVIYTDRSPLNTFGENCEVDPLNPLYRRENGENVCTNCYTSSLLAGCSITLLIVIVPVILIMTYRRMKKSNCARKNSEPEGDEGMDSAIIELQSEV